MKPRQLKPRPTAAPLSDSVAEPAPTTPCASPRGLIESIKLRFAV
jgi:hypothetical protein